MKVEQILYTRVGGSELGAGWQSRKSERFDADVERSCVYHFNRVVDSMLDKANTSPESIYAEWHSNKRICSARAIKIKDAFGRGNLLAHAYAVNENEYISVLSRPADFLCINKFADEMIENPEVLDELPQSDSVSLREVCRKYEITAEKMQQLVCLTLSAVLRQSTQGLTQRRSLKIVLDVPSESLYQASREIMTAVFSFMPCVMRLNTSFASYAHAKLEGMSVLFTNEDQDNYYYNIRSGDWKWSKDIMIPVTDMARVFVENRGNREFQRDIEDYVLHTGSVYNLKWDDMLAACLYAAIKNNISISISEDEMFKALAVVLKDAMCGIQDDYISYLVKYYIDKGGRIAPGHAEQMLSRYAKTKSKSLREAIDYYNFSNYVVNFNDRNFAGFCALQRKAPEFYNSTIQKALEAGSAEFLDKVRNDIVKSKETYSAFINSVSEQTKSEMFDYMLTNIFLKSDGSGYAALSNIRKKVASLYGALHGAALQRYVQQLKRYYIDFFIPEDAESFELLIEIKNTFGQDYDEELAYAISKKVVKIYEDNCRGGGSSDLYVMYRNMLYELGMEKSRIELLLEEAKHIFWENFSLSSWNANESYAVMSSPEYPICRAVSALESMAGRLRNSSFGDSVYNDVIKLLEAENYDSIDKINILSQLVAVVSSKMGVGNADDIVIMSLRPEDGSVDAVRLGENLANRRYHVRSDSIAISAMLEYAIRHCSYRQMCSIYETLMNSSDENTKVVNGFVRLCERNGLPIKRIQKEVGKKAATHFNTVTFVMIFVALSIGAGIGMIMQMLDVYSMSRGISSAITASAVIIAAAAVAAPAIRLTSNPEKNLGAIFGTVVFVTALIVFGSSLGLYASAIAFLAFLLSILM